jgi:hypothetical protein
LAFFWLFWLFWLFFGSFLAFFWLFGFFLAQFKGTVPEQQIYGLLILEELVPGLSVGPVKPRP